MRRNSVAMALGTPCCRVIAIHRAPTSVPRPTVPPDYFSKHPLFVDAALHDRRSGESSVPFQPSSHLDHTRFVAWSESARPPWTYKVRIVPTGPCPGSAYPQSVRASPAHRTSCVDLPIVAARDDRHPPDSQEPSDTKHFPSAVLIRPTHLQDRRTQ